MGKTHPYECPGHDIKQSDGEVPVLEKLRATCVKVRNEYVEKALYI